MSNPTQTQKMETTSNSVAIDDIEKELIKMTTNSNISRSQNADNSSIHSSALSKTGGPPYVGSIKSEQAG